MILELQGLMNGFCYIGKLFLIVYLCCPNSRVNRAKTDRFFNYALSHFVQRNFTISFRKTIRIISLSSLVVSRLPGPSIGFFEDKISELK